MSAKKFGKNAEQIQGVDVVSTTPSDKEVFYFDSVSGKWKHDKTIVTTLGSTDATIPTSLAVKTITDGKKNYHGFVNRTDSTIVWDNTLKKITLTGTFDYWFQGVKKTHSDSPSVTMSAEQISTAGLYYVYFNTSDVLNISTIIPSYESAVFVALVYWNTSTAVVREERHGYRLSQDWRRWAHNTIGCRYGSGLALTIPVNTGNPNTTISVATGTIWDEDIDYSSTSPTTQVRIFYQNSVSTLTYIDALSARPYKYGSTGVQFVDSTNSYALTDCASGRYVNVWVYAVPGIIPATGAYGENISIVLETIAGNAGYTTVANARAVSPPNLALLTAVSPEIKLIYRLVVKGDGVIDTIVAADDYRTATTLSGGAVTTIDAASVIFAPTGNVSSITVQSAIAELDSEKAATGQKLDDFGTPDDNTDLDATTSHHGLLPKVVAGASSGLIKILQSAYGATAASWAELFDATNPAMNGSAAPGTATTAARRDHVHASDTSRAPVDNPTFTTGITTPAIKITGGTPGAGKVLTSDADGDATWETASGGLGEAEIIARAIIFGGI